MCIATSADTSLSRFLNCDGHKLKLAAVLKTNLGREINLPPPNQERQWPSLSS